MVMRCGYRLLIGVMALGLVSGLTLTAPTTSVDAASAPTYDQSVGVLQLYVKYLNAKKYRDAYNLRGTSLQRRQSYSSFAAGFSRTTQNTLRVSGTTAVGAQTVVRCQLSAALASGSWQTFRGSYTIGRENGRFRIVSANLTVFGGPLVEPPG